MTGVCDLLQTALHPCYLLYQFTATEKPRTKTPKPPTHAPSTTSTGDATMVSPSHYGRPMRSRRHGSRGYSLTELLTVIAIIAIASLVTIPQFITYQRNSLLKSSMRNFINDVRYARQLAVSKHDITRISFT